MVKAIIFDLQGTLIENGVYPSPTKQVRYLMHIREPFRDYVTRFEKVFMVKKFATLAEAFNEVADEFRVRLTSDALEKLVGVWNKNKLLSKLYPETIEVLKELKSKYKLVLVANIDSLSKDMIDKYQFNEYFDLIMLSCESGMLKTDSAFFDEILSKINVEASDALMVGDSLDSDMRSAENAGVDSVLIDRNGRMDYSKKISNLTELKNFL